MNTRYPAPVTISPALIRNETARFQIEASSILEDGLARLSRDTVGLQNGGGAVLGVLVLVTSQNISGSAWLHLLSFCLARW